MDRIPLNRSTGRGVPPKLLAPLLVLAAASISVPAEAAGRNCPFVGAPDGFQAPEDPLTIGYDTREFRDQKHAVQKTGRVCKQIYRLEPGAPKRTAVAIMAPYAKSLPAAGARITNPERTADDDIYATLRKNGVERWLYVYESDRDTVTVIEVQVAPLKRTLLPPSGNDYKLLGHMPGVSPRPPVVQAAAEVELSSRASASRCAGRPTR